MELPDKYWKDLYECRFEQDEDYIFLVKLLIDFYREEEECSSKEYMIKYKELKSKLVGFEKSLIASARMYVISQRNKYDSLR